MDRYFIYIKSTGYLFRENKMWMFYNMETCRLYAT